MNRNKKMVTIIIGFCVLFCLGLGAIVYYFNTKTIYYQYSEIAIEDILTQKSKEFYVYFYSKDCGYCVGIENDFHPSFTENNLFLVNMEKSGNSKYMYDWDTHHKEYDIKIGEIVDDQEIYYHNESRTKYENKTITNSEGFDIEYGIAKGLEYTKLNYDGDANGIYAVDYTPRITLDFLNEGYIYVTGTPMLLKVKDGQIIDIYSGFDASNLLKGGESGENQ